MKKIGLAAFILAVVVGVTVAGIFSFGRFSGRLMNFTTDDRIKGSGVMSTETRDARDFNSVEVSGVFEVTIAAQKEYGVRIEGEDNLLSHVKIDVDGQTLRISSDEDLKPRSAIKIFVSAPEIESVDASGVSHITVTEVKSEEFRTNISGASSLKVSGTAETLNADVSGASGLDAEELVVRSAKAVASGASKATVNASQDLDVESSGASNIKYVGDPKNIEREASGVSSISRK